MPLTDKAIQALKPRDDLYRVADGGGLCLEVTTGGRKFWRYRYRMHGRAKMLALGEYPAVGLAAARQALHQARAQQATGVCPSAAKVATRATRRAAAGNTLAAVALPWAAKLAAVQGLARATVAKHTMLLNNDILPELGAVPVGDITARHVLGLLERIGRREAWDIAKRAHNLLGRIMKYAVAQGLAQRNPVADVALADVLAGGRAQQHHPSVTNPVEVGALLRACAGYTGGPLVQAALMLGAYTFVRPGELRRMEWQEIDWDRGEWRIPASKMKMGEQHIVPLSRQAVGLLRGLQAAAGGQQAPQGFVFPSARTRTRPMSENAVTAALARMGFKGEMTGHGFRSMASTLLHEMGYDHGWIEAQLAHGERGVSASYNFAKYLDQRRGMMQAWADYLDSLKSGAVVIPMKKGAK